MGRCKDIVIKVIPKSVADPFVKKVHYSGKVVPNSQLNFGCFLDGEMHGVMQFGPSMQKSVIQNIVEGTQWNGFLELNRMAFDDYLPRNSESYCIGYALRQIRKLAPQIKWVVSFADGTQCGDGTIYRASNFLLTGIKPNRAIIYFPITGDKVAGPTLTSHPNGVVAKRLSNALNVECKPRPLSEGMRIGGGKYIPGYMLRYIYFIDPKYKNRLTVPILPFSKIDEMNAGMYKGENVKQEIRHAITTEMREAEERKE